MNKPVPAPPDVIIRIRTMWSNLDIAALPDFADALRLHELLDAIQDSSASGERVRLR